jgi:hypothetical protein
MQIVWISLNNVFDHNTRVNLNLVIIHFMLPDIFVLFRGFYFTTMQSGQFSIAVAQPVTNDNTRFFECKLEMNLFLLLSAYNICSKYQFYNLWFDPTRVQTHMLPFSKRPCYYYTIDAVLPCLGRIIRLSIQSVIPIIWRFL